MKRDALVALTTQIEAELDEALDTVAHLAVRAKFTEAHIAAKAQAILAVLATPYEDPADTTVGDIVTGAPTEQADAARPPRPPGG